MIVAEFSYSLGQTWDYVDEHLTIEQVKAYRRYWLQCPQTHILAAGFMGYKGPSGAVTDRDMQELAAAIGMRLPDGKQ